jgi:hypothetical protein
VGKEQASSSWIFRNAAQKDVQLCRLELHCTINEAEAIMRDCTLVCGRSRMVGCAIKDSIVRGDAAERERNVGTLDNLPILTQVHYASYGFSLCQAQEDEMSACLLRAQAAACEQ